MLKDVIDKHAPIKERYNKASKSPYMNGELRRAVYKKRMLRNKYNEYRSPVSWDLYRKQRNQVTRLKRQSLRTYFFERCAGGPKSKDFWPTIKPFLSKKSSQDDTDIILCEDNKIVSEQSKVCNIFNDYFINVAKDIGSCKYTDFSKHPSITAIRENADTQPDSFQFCSIDQAYVHTAISKLHSKKATGVDGISAKLLKSCSSSVSQPVCDLINFSLGSCSFPGNLKKAQVIPIFKKKDPLDKQNYRPVSILPTVSKIFERVLHDQLASNFEHIFSPFLAAFRKGYGCQTTLLRILEDWRRAVDNHKCVGAILMDLSKAFDCLPHELLLAKFKAYGLSEKAVELLGSYLANRKQRIKVGSHTSNWEEIFKGVPQGSILGPLMFNVFINDIFYFVQDSDLYNYADDNTLSYTHTDCNILKSVLEKDSETLITWFEENCMKANPEKFQAICIGKKANEQIKSFHIDDIDILCEENVSLLGVNIDYLLKFDDHVSEICKKASRQLAVLKRIGKFLTKQGRLIICLWSMLKCLGSLLTCLKRLFALR
jgi:hypothetical protein